jgi:hypothetical protein
MPKSSAMIGAIFVMFVKSTSICFIPWGQDVHRATYSLALSPPAPPREVASETLTANVSSSSSYKERHDQEHRHGPWYWYLPARQEGPPSQVGGSLRLGVLLREAPGVKDTAGRFFLKFCAIFSGAFVTCREENFTRLGRHTHLIRESERGHPA